MLLLFCCVQVTQPSCCGDQQITSPSESVNGNELGPVSPSSPYISLILSLLLSLSLAPLLLSSLIQFLPPAPAFSSIRSLSSPLPGRHKPTPPPITPLLQVKERCDVTRTATEEEEWDRDWRERERERDEFQDGDVPCWSLWFGWSD